MSFYPKIGLGDVEWSCGFKSYRVDLKKLLLGGLLVIRTSCKT